VIQSAPANLKWYVVGGLVAAGVVAAVVWAKLATPSRTSTALAVETRFGLRERVTTGLGPGPTELATPAGQAVLADASAKLSKVAVGEKFPVRPRWHAALVPGLAACVALAAIYPIPVVQELLAETATGPDGKKADDKTIEKPQPKNPTPFTQRNKPPELANREDKSKELKDLEEQINQMMRKFDTDPNRETQEKLKEKVAELTAMREKVKKFNQEKFERMQKLEQQLQQLDRLNKDQDFQDGPAKKLNDALSKGDLPAAQDQLDQLKKKIQDKKLTKEEAEQLSRQLEKMKQQLQQLERNKERQKKLEEMIKKAKEEGREQDAESLNRELKQLEQEAKECAECSKQLAQNFQKAQEALQNGNFEEAANELEKAAQNLQAVEGELQDLEDAEQYLQRLKSECESACKKCQGEGEGPPERRDYADGQGQASGLRPENKDAKTSSEDQRLRGIFDPRGKKTYGGATKGQAFKKATTAELGPAIQQAAQDAPTATDSGRYSRDAKETVKEYFQNLGGQGPGGK
jgi:uncharacterized coiled-coil DUF342 family protein